MPAAQPDIYEVGSFDVSQPPPSVLISNTLASKCRWRISRSSARYSTPPSATLRSEHLQTEPLYAVVPVSHRLARRRSLRIVELANDTFVLNDRRHSPVVFDKVITLCAQAGITPRIGGTATVGSGVITLVEAGEGIAILPQGSRSLGSEALVFITLTDGGASVDLVIAWSVQHSNPAVDSFLELIRKRRRKNPGVTADG